MSDALVARMLARRERWLPLPDGRRRLRVRRPPEAKFARFVRAVEVADLAECIVGWDGFTEADLLGASIGSDAPAAFSADVVRTWLEDNVAEFGRVVEALAEDIAAHLKAREAASGN